MRKVILISLVFFLTGNLFSQHFLALDVYRPFNMKRIRYYQKDRFACKLKGSSDKHSGTIQLISDSAIMLSTKKGVDSIRIDQIRMVIVDRSNFLTRQLSTFLIEGGIGFILIDSFNNIINNETTILKPQVVKNGSIVLGAGILFKLLLTKRHHVGKRKILRAMDMSPY